MTKLFRFFSAQTFRSIVLMFSVLGTNMVLADDVVPVTNEDMMSFDQAISASAIKSGSKIVRRKELKKKKIERKSKMKATAAKTAAKKVEKLSKKKNVKNSGTKSGAVAGRSAVKNGAKQEASRGKRAAKRKKAR